MRTRNQHPYPLCVRVGCSYLIHQFLQELQAFPVIFVIMFVILAFAVTSCRWYINRNWL